MDSQQLPLLLSLNCAPNSASNLHGLSFHIDAATHLDSPFVLD